MDANQVSDGCVPGYQRARTRLAMGMYQVSDGQYGQQLARTRLAMSAYHVSDGTRVSVTFYAPTARR